jgi:hypothetical protein
MKLPDSVYTVLKWLVCICLPALTVAYTGLDACFGWGHADTVAKVSAIVCTLIGSLIGISTADYYKDKTGKPEE